MTCTAARNSLAQALERVVRDHAPILITRRKGAPAVLMSREDFDMRTEVIKLVSVFLVGNAGLNETFMLR